MSKGNHRSQCLEKCGAVEEETKLFQIPIPQNSHHVQEKTFEFSSLEIKVGWIGCSFSVCSHYLDAIVAPTLCNIHYALDSIFSATFEEKG
jgi:hypothetical protein